MGFSSLSAPLVEAAMDKVTPDGIGLNADTAAQMYAALLLLGHSPGAVPDCYISSFLGMLSSHLRGCIKASSLSLSSVVSLCYAMLLVPPGTGRTNDPFNEHPIEAILLLERCVQEPSAMSEEDRLLLPIICQALEMLPWNRAAVQSAQRLRLLTTASLPMQSDLPAPFFISAIGHLVPLLGSAVCWELQPWLLSSPSAEEASSPASSGQRSHQRASCVHRASYQGAFVAQEIRMALEEISAVLSARQIDHSLVLGFEAEAFVAVQRASLLGSSAALLDAKDVAVLWGSPVHYISDSSTEAAVPRLSPAARFQVSVLRALRGFEVVVVPHWQWPWDASPTAKVNRLVELLEEAPGR